MKVILIQQELYQCQFCPENQLDQVLQMVLHFDSWPLFVPRLIQISGIHANQLQIFSQHFHLCMFDLSDDMAVSSCSGSWCQLLLILVRCNFDIQYYYCLLSYLWNLSLMDMEWCEASDAADKDPVNIEDDTHRDKIPSCPAQPQLLCQWYTFGPGQILHLSSCLSAFVAAQRQGNHWEHLSQYRCWVM